MRKKLLIFGLFIIGLLASTTTNAATAGTKFTVDGICYEIYRNYRTEVKVVKPENGNYSGCIDLPESVTYNGITYPVALIERMAFCDADIERVTIPKSVTTLASLAFSRCNIGELVISDSSERLWLSGSVGDEALKDTKIATLYLGRDLSSSMQMNKVVSTIPLKSTESLKIGKYVTKLDNVDILYHRLSSIFVSPENKHFSTDGKALFRSRGGGETIELCVYQLENYTIPSGVITIADRAFSANGNIKSIEMPSSIYRIGAEAFSGCHNLENVVIPKNVGQIHIEDAAFAGCSALKYIFIPWSFFTNLGSRVLDGFSGTLVLMRDLKGDSKALVGIGPNATIYTKRAYIEDVQKSYTGSNLHAVEDYLEMADVKSFLRKVAFNLNILPSASQPVKVNDFFHQVYSSSGTSDIGIVGKTSKSYAVELKNGFPDCNYYIVCDCQIGEWDVPIPYEISTAPSNITFSDMIIDQTSVVGTVRGDEDESAKISKFIVYLRKNDIDRESAEANSKGGFKISGLLPNKNYEMTVDVWYSGSEFPVNIYNSDVLTRQINPIISGEAGPTSFTAEGAWTEGDAKIDAYGFATGIDVATLTNQRRYMMGGLDPETTTKIAFGVAGPWGAEWTDREFTTAALTWETPGATATSLSSARMMVETNCDAETGTGFEWRRIDAPELVPSTQAPCPVVDGRLVGSLRNLNSETYYKFRPYYTSASGKTYYGEWTGLFTGDANVYFEPEVRTLAESLTGKRIVRLAGYALAGSDDITEQGFQYRAVGKAQAKARAAETWQSVAAKGIKMEATLDDLAYGTTYRYRAYAVTAKGTFYGDEREFSTEAESGIEDVVADAEEGLTVALRENPATGTAWVRVTGADAAEARYRLTSVSGATVATGTLAADGTWQPVELTVPAGLYLLTVGDTTAARTVRLVVR